MFKRVITHIPAGLLNTAFFLLCPVFGASFMVGFLVYEVSQCWRIHDDSYQDILGHIIGMAIAGIIWLVRSYYGG